jgi:hypothetical protein
MTTQETLAQIEHLLVENERSIREELSRDLINRLYYKSCTQFTDFNRNTDKHWQNIPEAVEMMVVCKWLEKVKQEMENE